MSALVRRNEGEKLSQGVSLGGVAVVAYCRARLARLKVREAMVKAFSVITRAQLGGTQRNNCKLKIF